MSHRFKWSRDIVKCAAVGAWATARSCSADFERACLSDPAAKLAVALDWMLVTDPHSDNREVARRTLAAYIVEHGTPHRS